MPMPTSPAASAANFGFVKEKVPGRMANTPLERSARSAANRRSRASASTATGRRASRAMRSMIGSCSISVILDPVPPFPQAFARSFDAHLQGGDSRAGQRRHFLVAQLLDVFQEKSFSQQRAQF